MTPLNDNEARLPVDFVADLTVAERQRLDLLLDGAGLRLREAPYDVRVVSVHTAKPYILLEPLQTNKGYFRKDADRLLEGFLDAETRAADGREIARYLKSLNIDRFETNLQAAMVGFWTEADPLNVLRWLADSYDGIRFYRIRATRSWQYSDVFWRLMMAVCDEGLRFRDVIDRGSLPKPDKAIPLAAMNPALFATTPLVARLQPLAAVFITAAAAEIVAVAPGAFVRQPWMSWFPVSMGGSLDLAGSGQAAYETSFSTIPEEWGTQLLKSMVKGTGRIVAHFADPGIWRDGDGNLDPITRHIAHATVRVGLGAVNEIGAQWGNPETTWMAFRALGTLAGLWEGADHPSLIRKVLHPEIARQWAVADQLPASYQQWSLQILDLYRRELERLFPDQPIDDAVDQLVEIRNLLHGVAATPTRRRSERSRFDAMRRLGEGGLVHLQDLAAMWWTSVVLNPDTHAQPGKPPFA